MGKGQRTIKNGNTAVVQTRLRQLRLLLKLDQRQAAEVCGISYGHYRKLERNERTMSEIQMRRIAKAFNVEPRDLLEGPPSVPIAGVSDNLDGEITLSTEGSTERAPLPPGGNEATVALELRGSILRGIAADGWLFYFDDTKPAPSDAVLGELCVVGLANGKVMVRTPRRAAAPGRFHLEGLSGATLADMEITWAALVKAIIPRAQAQRLLAHQEQPMALAAVTKPPKSR